VKWIGLSWDCITGLWYLPIYSLHLFWVTAEQYSDKNNFCSNAMCFWAPVDPVRLQNDWVKYRWRTTEEHTGICPMLCKPWTCLEFVAGLSSGRCHFGLSEACQVLLVRQFSHLYHQGLNQRKGREIKSGGRTHKNFTTEFISCGMGKWGRVFPASLKVRRKKKEWNNVMKIYGRPGAGDLHL
jgi:hypothetical protein